MINYDDLGITCTFFLKYLVMYEICMSMRSISSKAMGGCVKRLS